MAYATVEDIEARLGRTLTDPELVQVAAWIEDVEAQIALRIPNMAALVAEGSPTPAVVKAVVASSVLRVLRNPEGLRQRTVSIDDYSETKTVDTTSSAGLLYLTDDEWSLLSPGSSGDAFTIRPYGTTRGAGEWVHPDTWIPL